MSDITVYGYLKLLKDTKPKWNKAKKHIESLSDEECLTALSEGLQTDKEHFKIEESKDELLEYLETVKSAFKRGDYEQSVTKRTMKFKFEAWTGNGSSGILDGICCLYESKADRAAGFC